MTHIPETQWASRINKHGKITDLSTEDFTSENNIPFSIFLMPKADTDKVCELVKLQCTNDEAAEDLPCQVNAWTEASIIMLSKDNNSLLTDYDIYWGAAE